MERASASQTATERVSEVECEFKTRASGTAQQAWLYSR
jgi:hypothetical protein